MYWQRGEIMVDLRHMSDSEVFSYMSCDDEGAMMTVSEILAHQNNRSLFCILDFYNIKGKRLKVFFEDCCLRDMKKLIITLNLFVEDVFKIEYIDTNLDMKFPLTFIEPDTYDLELLVNRRGIDWEKFSTEQRISFEQRFKQKTLSEKHLKVLN